MKNLKIVILTIQFVIQVSGNDIYPYQMVIWANCVGLNAVLIAEL